MAKPASNRVNFKYAQELKKRGFLTAIHALPDEALIVVHKMLEENRSGRDIANEVNAKFQKQIKKLRLKPITFSSVQTYKNKYWKETPSGKRAELKKDPELKQKISTVFAEFDALAEMAKLAKSQLELATMITEEKDKKTKLASGMGEGARLQAHTMLKDVVNFQLELGIIARTPLEVDLNLNGEVVTKPAEMSEEQKMLLAQEMGEMALALQGKGRYGKRKPKLHTNKRSKETTSV